MTIMNIITNPKKLHRVAEYISAQKIVDGIAESMVRDLIDTATYHYPRCIGLAAPQIGYNVRMFVMWDNSINEFITVINPEIMKLTGEKTHLGEGCMSRPGITVRKARRKRIKVRYSDEQGETFERNFSNVNARVFQHELDHLNGVLIDD